MKNILLGVSLMVMLLLCGCSNDALNGTYWRNEKTGEWLMGIVDGQVVYDCQFWNITSQTEEEDAFTIEAENGKEKLLVNISKEENNLRTFTINGKESTCSYISDYYLPDYPEKDETPLANNNYQEGDSVTIVGWIRPLPSAIEWLKSKIDEEEGNSHEVSVSMIANILTDEEPSFKAPIDSLGHFTLRMPIVNTTSFYLDCDKWDARVVAEPNETYFLMIDPIEDKKLFMGKNARLQNEINAHSITPKAYGIDNMEKMGGIMNILDSVKIQTQEKMQELDNMCKEHPTLSERFRTYYRNKILTNDARNLMQGMYLAPNDEVPEEYRQFVDENYWKLFAEPYTMEAYTFSQFLNDYSFRLQQNVQDKNAYTMKWIMESAEKDGIVSLSAKDRAAIKQYDAAYPAYHEKRKNAPDSLQETIDEEFGRNDFVKNVIEIQNRSPQYQDYSQQKYLMRELELMVKEMDAREWSETVQDLMLCRILYKNINWSRQPLGKEILTFTDEHIHMPAALHAVHAINDKYEKIGKGELTHADNLKSNEAVKDMSEGEQILKKLLEPYKGKIVLLDIWGTWCGPCKMLLSHSQEEYEQLKDYDIIYMYLANHSPEESWKNAIKEYQVMGENVVHYNLPDEQQKAVENHLGVHAFPTYKLFDQQGRLLDVNADPSDLDALENLLKRISKK